MSQQYFEKAIVLVYCTNEIVRLTEMKERERERDTTDRQTDSPGIIALQQNQLFPFLVLPCQPLARGMHSFSSSIRVFSEPIKQSEELGRDSSPSACFPSTAILKLLNLQH